MRDRFTTTRHSSVTAHPVMTLGHPLLDEEAQQLLDHSGGNTGYLQGSHKNSSLVSLARK